MHAHILAAVWVSLLREPMKRCLCEGTSVNRWAFVREVFCVRGYEREFV